MWIISISSARFADESLASMSVECPTNLLSDDGFGLWWPFGVDDFGTHRCQWRTTAI